MNNLEIVEGAHYKVGGMGFIEDLFVIKKVKIRNWFSIVDGITYLSRENSSLEREMTEKEFHRIALYLVK